MIISEEECLATWESGGWCECKRCEDYSNASDAIEKVTSPSSRFKIFNIICKETNQDAKTAKLNMEYLIDTGVLVEKTPNMFVFV